MGVNVTNLEDLRTQLQTELQDLLTYDPGGGDVLEAKVVQQFTDTPEIYPCVFLRFGAGTSPSRYTGTADLPLYTIEVFCLSLRASRAEHIVTCEDGKKRSGRKLVEYLALKIHNFLANGFTPNFNYAQSDIDLELDSDYEERDGVFRSTLLYQIMV